MIILTLVVVLVCSIVIFIAAWRAPTSPVKIGATGLVIGLLIYFAARNAGGGLAGVFPFTPLPWGAFWGAPVPPAGRLAGARRRARRPPHTAWWFPCAS